MYKGIQEVLAITNLTESTFKLKITRGDLTFIAGQCMNLGIPDAGVNREYSSYSGEHEPFLEFLIKEVDGGIVSSALKKLKPGDKVEVDGAYGDFRLFDPNKHSYLFVGSGTGIAPFHSFAVSYPRLNYKVIHGIRFAREMYDKKDFGTDRYVSCLSREEGGDFKGYVTDYLKNYDISSDTHVYLCGNRLMIADCYDLLRQKNVNGSHIFTETFF